MIRNTTAFFVVVGFAFALTTSTIQAEENWSYWRGPNFTGASGEMNLPETWDPEGGEGSNLKWAQEIGSRSTPTIMDGKLYLLTTANPDDESKMGEKVVCLDADTGSTVWEHEFNVYLSDVPAERVGWSSVVCDPETGNVYALGVCGYFCCLDGESGKLVWNFPRYKSLHEEYGLLSTYGGRTNFPIIHEDNVIVSAVVIGWGDMAKPAHRFIAFDKRNGVPVWFSGTTPLPFDTTYSAPVLGVIDGELQMIFASGDGAVHGMQPRTGKLIWSYYVSGRGINTSPLVVDGKVYCGHSEENLDTTDMGAIFCIDPTADGDVNPRTGAKDITKSGEVWRKTGFFVGRSSPIMFEDRLYAVDDRGTLHSFDPTDGEPLNPLDGTPMKDLDRKAKRQIQRETSLGTMMRANLLIADGKIYANEVSRGAYIFKPTENGIEQLEKVRYQRGEEAHGSPIAHNGRVYIPTTGNLYCIEKPDAVVRVEDLPGIGEETHSSGVGEPAQAQLVPCELLLRPGFKQGYHVRLYDDRGRYLRMALAENVDFEIDGPGSMDQYGMYKVGSDQKGHAAATITAEVDNLKAEARVRIVPSLPWSFDFDDGEIPVTWIGARYRHIALDFDLMKKLREEDQLASDLYIYFMTEFTNGVPPGHTEGVFDDSSPRQRWTALLTYLDLAAGERRPQTVEDAKQVMDASLQKLVDERVILTPEWSTWDQETGASGETTPQPKLTVIKGQRLIDGNGVMCKIKTIPLGARSQGWMGHADLHDYTIQADVYGFSRDDKMPDIGLIGQRYTLDMMGASQQLQIRTWTPQLNRVSFEAPFEWQPDQWYTMKFRTAVEGGNAVLKGKVWKKGEEEPKEWQVEGVDEMPNVVGSPGLFGNAKDAEIFYDNITVQPN